MPGTAERPNILLFLTDDHAQWASGCYGHHELVTPNLDYLAASGARLVNAFTPSPVCSPARACLWTGRLPSQHGVHDWLDERGVAVDHPGLGGQPTLAMLLQAVGYRTGLVGKWHCGRSWEPQPGFERWFSYWLAQHPHRGDVVFSDQGRRVVATGQQAALITDQALAFVREKADTRPFFLTVGYVCTHTPHRDQPERWVTRYRDCAFSDIPDEAPALCHGRARYAWPHAPGPRREEMAQYYAAVSYIDEQVGRLLETLDGAGRLDDTLVVYVSDHGHMNGHHGLHTKGNATIPQNLVEESIRVPCLLRWPGGGVRAAERRTEFTDHVDLFQTLLDVAGTSAPAEPALPGRSYLTLLCGATPDAPWRDAQFGEYGNARMIRTVRHKLIRRAPGPGGAFGDELYDLIADPRETANRIDDPACTTVLAALSGRLAAHFARYEDPARSGWEIAGRPRCSPTEPWRAE